MALSDIFKINQNQSELDSLKQDCEKYKAELDTLKQNYENLQMQITPEMQNALTLQQEISRLQNEQMQEQAKLNELKSAFTSKNSELSNLEQTIQEKRAKIVRMDDEILVQEFGLYKPQYDFASALVYKDELAKIRSLQKELIKNNKAVNGNPRWTIDGSISKGNKMVYDTQKLLLRAFNAECDELVSKVRYTNFDASLNKIHKSAGTISKLGSIMGISITQYYLDAKIKELRLAFEYQLKKQQEKEEEKEAHAQMREAAKLQKEIEEQRKKFEKVQTHYQTVYEKIKTQLSQHPDDVDLLAKKAELETRLSEIQKSLNDIDYREANARAGYVYVISNIGAFGENIYKIGMTRRLDPQERVDELGDASVPFNFDVHAMIFSDDAPALEAALHRAFEDRKLNMVNHRREFFNVTLDEIKKVINDNYDKTVEFIDVPDAEQYRISQKMRADFSINTTTIQSTDLSSPTQVPQDKLIKLQKC